MGRSRRAHSAAPRGSLGPRDVRGVQPGRDHHRVRELRRVVPHLGRVQRDVPQDVHGRKHVSSVPGEVFAEFAVLADVKPEWDDQTVGLPQRAHEVPLRV